MNLSTVILFNIFSFLVFINEYNQWITALSVTVAFLIGLLELIKQVKSLFKKDKDKYYAKDNFKNYLSLQRSKC